MRPRAATLTPTVKKGWFKHVMECSGYESIHPSVRQEFEKGIIRRHEVVERCKCRSANELAPAYVELTIEIPGTEPLYHSAPLEWLPTDRYAPLVMHLEKYGINSLLAQGRNRLDFYTCGRCSYDARCYVVLARPGTRAEEPETEPEGGDDEARRTGNEDI